MNAALANTTPTNTINAAGFAASGSRAGGQGLHGTIGSDRKLCERIQPAFTKLGKAREACFGAQAYLSATASFKRDFAIRRMQSWTIVMTWPAYRAAEILNYLDGRYNEAVGYH